MASLLDCTLAEYRDVDIPSSCQQNALYDFTDNSRLTNMRYDASTLGLDYPRGGIIVTDIIPVISSFDSSDISPATLLAY